MEEEKREFEERGRKERLHRRKRREADSIYVGEVKDGKRNGIGTLTLPDGEMYEGEFKDGEYNGRGTLTLPDGETYEGEFKDGKPWTVTFTDLDGSKTEWKDGYEI